ncbi:hypothetical protein F3Y22_tig00110469pilonHSYRG00064 [Hibiscus syriacus]|uniref:Uncharacterized protein n=1 Tax=Hibiscus syriacus TaxID=106335 RepID=A0A6A3AKY3_HIBSY|nr:hypothetical protein F3Y22_tig00110469pilonHSYRG00064 [Hibiscus syriacus]
MQRSQMNVMKLSIGRSTFDEDGVAVKMEMAKYDQLTHRSISVGNSKVSPLESTSISWAIGLVLASTLLLSISTNLDHSPNQQLITGAVTALGAFFCIPAGFFEVTWIFPVYIAPIVFSITIATASHTRHHGQMVRGFTGTSL